MEGRLVRILESPYGRTVKGSSHIQGCEVRHLDGDRYDLKVYANLPPVAFVIVQEVLRSIKRGILAMSIGKDPHLRHGVVETPLVRYRHHSMFVVGTVPFKRQFWTGFPACALMEMETSRKEPTRQSDEK